MKGKYVKFKDYVLSNYGVVEQAYYENLSIDVLTIDRALLPPEYFGIKRNFKDVTIEFRYFHKNMKVEEIEKELDKIIGKLHSIKIDNLTINSLNCQAVMSEAKRVVLGNTGFITFRFINLDGLFYSEEKQKNLGTVINIDSLIDTSFFKIEGIPNIDNPTITHITTGIKTILTNAPRQKIVIDYNKKFVKSGDREIPIHLYIDFFELRNGENKFNVTGLSNPVIKYREVLAL